MRAATESFALLTLALAACGEAAQEGSVNHDAATEIEALPPDESVEAPADEPVNDAAEPSNEDAAQY